MAFIIKITLFLVINVAISQAITTKQSNDKAATAPNSPSPDNYSPIRTHDDAVLDCAAKLSRTCGREIVGVILDRNKDAGTVVEDCCLELVMMGRECHVALLNNLAKYYYKDDKGYIMDKGEDVWMHCAVTMD